MAINDVTLTAGMRSNLVTLQSTAKLLDRTQTRLSTGKKVNNALDNPIAFFAAQAATSRAGDLSTLKDSMSQAVETIKAANNGITSITSLIAQAKALGQAAESANSNQIKIQFTSMTAGDTIAVGGATYTAALSAGGATFDPTTMFVAVSDMNSTVANIARLVNQNDESSATIGGTDDMAAIASGTTLILQAKSASTAITQGNYTNYADATGVTQATVLTDVTGYQVFSERATLGNQYNDIMGQIDAVAGASGYGGINLLADQTLNVAFENSTLAVKGFSATASDLNLNTMASHDVSGTNWGWSVTSEIGSDLGKLDVATQTLKSQASQMANNLGIINIQSDFATNMINTLNEGADSLTLADMNEEGANMLMLQTRQQLGTTALSLSAQAAQSVLRLF